MIVAVATLLVIVAPGRWLPGVHGSAFIILDAVALGLWTAVGTAFALDADVSVVGALFVGVVAGLAGGVLVALLRGQTLADVAFAEYHDAREWRRITDANGIDDPLSVMPGTRLLVPPILKR